MSKNTHICNRCENNSLTFKSPHYSPEEYFEGNPKAKVWIIGLNPKLDDDKKKHTDQKKKDLRVIEILGGQKKDFNKIFFFSRSGINCHDVI